MHGSRPLKKFEFKPVKVKTIPGDSELVLKYFPDAVEWQVDDLLFHLLIEADSIEKLEEIILKLFRLYGSNVNSILNTCWKMMDSALCGRYDGKSTVPYKKDSMNINELVREYFPSLPDNELNNFVWSCTSYPFLGKGDKKPYEDLRDQLIELSERSGNNWEKARQICMEELEKLMKN